MRQYDDENIICAAEYLIRISANINSWVYDLYNKE